MRSEMDDTELEKYMVERTLEPIMQLVEDGVLAPDVAVALLAKELEKSRNDDSPEYARFKANSRLIYENELFFDASYRMPTGQAYNFAAPSKNDLNTMFKLYQHLSGRDYNSPEQLRDIMRELLSGKRVLELGCGPGFNLKVMQDLGAKVSGIETRQELIGRVSVDVRHGDAGDLDKVFAHEEFDLIYSRNLFGAAVMDYAKSASIAGKLRERTRNGGMGLHQLTYEQLPLPLLYFSVWADARLLRRNFEEMKEWFWGQPRVERESMRYTNRCSLDPQYLLRAGFKLAEYSVENGELSIVVKC